MFSTTTTFKNPSCRLATQLGLRSQRGASLFTVLVLLLVTGLLVLASLSSSLFNERIVGNQADSQRTYAAAEALMRYAAEDIRKSLVHCDTDCRYPRNTNDFEEMAIELMDTCGKGGVKTETPKGVCIPSSPDAADFQSNNILVPGKPMEADSALTYAELSADFGKNVKVGDTELSKLGANGKFWVEIFQYNIMASSGTDTSAIPVPDTKYPFIYRITVRAEGLRPGTVSILRSFYVPFPRPPIS